MRLIRSKRTAITWRTRAVQLALALAGTGLMTAIAAAAIGAGHSVSTEKAMAAAIVAQEIAEGQVPAPPATSAPIPTESVIIPGSPQDLEARKEILEDAVKLEQQMLQTIDHTETLRTGAYKQKDMIRLSVITTKLENMKQIMSIAKDAFAALRVPGQDLFVMRAKLSLIRQGWDRMRELLQAAESAEGDDVNLVISGLGPENSESGNSQGDSDPTGPGTPTSDQTAVIGDRPAYASPAK